MAPLSAITLAYAAFLGATLWQAYADLSGADELAYIATAENLANIDFPRALNAFKPMLIALFTAPFVKVFGITDLQMVRLPTYAVGLAFLAAIYLYSASLLRSVPRQLLLTIALVPFVVASVSTVNSEITGAIFALLLVWVLQAGYFVRSTRTAVTAGLILGVSLFAKTYLYYVALVLLPLAAAYSLWQTSPGPDRSRILRNAAIALTVVLAIGAVAGETFAQKYGYFTLGAAGRYNHIFQNPDWVAAARFHPQDVTPSLGLIDLPHPRAASIFEDQTYITDQMSPALSWSPFDSVRNLRWLVGSVAWRTYYRLLPQGQEWPLSLAVIIGLFALLFVRQDPLRRRVLATSAAAFTVAVGAALSVNYKPAYLTGFYMSALCLVAAFLFEQADRGTLRRTAAYVLVFGMAFSFSVLEIKPLLDEVAASSGQGRSRNQIALEEGVAALSPLLSGKRVASDGQAPYTRFTHLCFLARCGYLGIPSGRAPWPAQLDELTAHSVDLFLAKATAAGCPPDRPGLRRLRDTPVLDHCVYAVL